MGRCPFPDKPGRDQDNAPANGVYQSEPQLYRFFHFIRRPKNHMGREDDEQKQSQGSAM